ncbi:transient receptor potential cation channel subfamily M member-like 2 [Mytilus edulis]|uniref:transient receptor potential cation channel subfamily M member-like 2 n=1 Tax=Mytilus edulis TaxID=6550 RepID=UPI0039F1218E
MDEKKDDLDPIEVIIPNGNHSPGVAFKNGPSSEFPSPKTGTSPHIEALQNLFSLGPPDLANDKYSQELSNEKHSPLLTHKPSQRVKFPAFEREASNESDADIQFFMGKNVDEIQRTVRSLGDISVDTQNSDTYQNAPFKCGHLKFDSKKIENFEHKKHYVCVPWDATPYELTYFMERFWNMRSPKIVLSIMSGVRNEKIWKNPRLRDQFKKGLIKAANSTEMWIVTNGVDNGIASIVGEAVNEEKFIRTNSRVDLSQLRPDAVKKFHRLTVIGVIQKQKVIYNDQLDGSEGLTLTNEGCKPNKDIHELNPDHTHFILVESETEDHYIDFRSNFEKQLECQLGRPRRYRRLLSYNSDENEAEVVEPPPQTIPVVGLLIQGRPQKIDLVLFYLRHKMPVVVVKGTGGCANLLAYAIEETQDRSVAEVGHLSPELLKLIIHNFPDDFNKNDFARNAFRDKIIECITLSKEDDRTFMTVINTQGADGNLADLDKYILKALLKSEIKKSSRWRERAYKDLTLLLDWNRADLAQTEIFSSQNVSKIKVDKTLFEKSLIRKDREEFVSLFLEQGYQIHKYLNHKNLKYLFERAEDSEFFSTVCLEGILGKHYMIPDQSLPNDFLINDLNKLVAKLSGIKDFIQPYELSMNSAELYVLDPAVAERKAVNCLIVWAVLLSRPKLAKVLWYRCDEPIPVALICSNIYRELSKCPMERSQRNDMEERAKEFGNMALGVLDISYRDTSAQAYSMLCRPLPDFNNKSTIEIAHNAYYLNFIAHPCCQKWLTRKLYGSIQMKELNWGICRLPYWFKILSSVFLIFPMFIWISFVDDGKKKEKKGRTTEESYSKDDDFSEASSSDEETAILPRTKSEVEMELNNLQRRKSVKKFPNLFRQKRQEKIPVSRKIQMLWTAPITKFWITQMFYFIYLGLFCLAVLWPTCGNLYLDLIVWVWTVIILLELIRHTYVKHQIHRGMSLLYNFFEMTVMIIFLIMYLCLRIVPSWINFSDIYITKTVLSVGLIFFFYRLPHIYLPISPTLGPMLVRINRMVSVDFVSFIRMFLIFMISGGVTIQAILYPNYPLGKELFRRVFTRPLFAMFLTQIDDLSGYDDCTPKYDNLTSSYCVNNPFQSAGSHMYKPEPDVANLQKCPMSSLSGYVITIQYLLICKLVLVTLLFAMFSLTIGKVDKEAAAIWKFQRYLLIMDFEERLCFPAPLTVINYIYILIQYIHRRLSSCRQSCISFCTCTTQKKKMNLSHTVQKLKRSEDYNYWKKCSHEYVSAQEEQTEVESIQKMQAQILQNLQDDMRFQRKTMRQMTDRIMELDRMMHSSRMYLESISHKLDKNDVLGISTNKGGLVHVAARHSPYPGTSLTRFQVLDKDVPWNKTCLVYDPKTFTKPADAFPDEERIYVDEDILFITLQQHERELLTEEERAVLPRLPVLNMVWNKVVTQKVPGVKGKRMFDRRSWIMMDNEMCRYKIDPLGLPLNPMGRTGLIGRGALWQWGPNHQILAVCTRWRRTDSADGQAPGFLYVEGKKVMEFIAVKKSDDGDETSFGLPGEYLHGLVSRYSTLIQAFKRDVLDEPDGQGKANLDQGDLIQYFSQFAELNLGSITNLGPKIPGTNLTRSTSHPCLNSAAAANIVPTFTAMSKSSSKKTDIDSTGFSASQVYKGYIDDPRNTDNAWIEAEVWNFHYDAGDIYDIKLPDDSNKVMWKEVSPNVRIYGNEGVIVQEAAKIQDAYF